MTTRTATNDAAKQALANTAKPSAGTTIAQYIEKQKPAIKAALPRNIDVDRFSRIVLSEVRRNPDLLSCDPMSILAATMQSAQLGLEPGSGLGEAYLIPYKREATFQMGYKGIVKLARNSGDVGAMWAEAVYEGDLFRVVMGSEPKIVHEPAFDIEGRGTYAAMTHVYAVAKLSSGDTMFSIMTKAEIEQHKTRYSRGATSTKSPWSDPLGAVEMAKKTVVLRLGKMLPLSAEVARAFASDGTVRRELSVDMSSLPDAEEEKAKPADIGAEVEPEIVDVDDNGEIQFADDGEVQWPGEE